MPTTLRPHHHLLIAALLLLAGLAIRLPFLSAPPTEFHATRQYRAALIARAWSDAALAPLSATERGNAATMAVRQDTIEPPLMESAAAWLYDVTGREDLRAPRLLAILGWLLGACGVWWLVRVMTKAPAPAHIALGITLFLPFGVDASRAFMPDPWMTGLTVAALAAAVARHHASSRRAAILWAALVCLGAAATYVKPMAMILILPPMMVLDLRRFGLVRGLVVAALTSLAMAAPAALHYWSLVSSGSAVTQDRFFVDLWSERSFWLGWLEMIRRVIGVPLLVVSAVALLISSGIGRWFLIAAWLGYFALGLTFSHHISTHDYYSLPLIPLAAMSMAIGTHDVQRRFRLPAWSLAAPALLAAVVWLPAFTSRGLYGDVERAYQKAADYERVGQVVQHSAHVITLDGDYGFPLAYHARIIASQLPLSIDRNMSQRTGRATRTALDDLRARHGAYFVGTLMSELRLEPALRDQLEQRHLLLDMGGDINDWRYVVYDLSTPARAAFTTADTTPAAPPASAPPFGHVDAPPNPLDPAAAPVLMQGWALDDVRVIRVDIVGVGPEGEVRLGQAVHRGHRKDVAAAFPTFTGQERNAWSFSLLPQDFAQGFTSIVVRAVDGDGQVASIGQRQIKPTP